MDYTDFYDELVNLIAEKKYSAIKEKISEYNPHDIAELLSEFNDEKLTLVFRLLPKEIAANTFVELDHDIQANLIRNFSDSELKSVFEEMFLDDTVDVIEEMPANVVKRILKNADDQTRRQINEILNYPEDSAGSIMTVEYVDLKSTMTISEAFDIIKATGPDKETIYTCYVTDANRHLIGVTTVKDMLLTNEQTIGEMMETNIISVNTLDDKEEVGNMFLEYGLMAMPVVDKENRLVGIVTYDDAMAVISDAKEEDMQVMAAITPSDDEYLKMSVFKIWKSRIPWLLLLMISATFTGMIITSFEHKLASLVVLTAFIPMLMDTGGNTGSQASVTVIRGLSLEQIRFRDIFKVQWKEIRVAFLCGIVLAAANFAKIILVDCLLLKTSGLYPLTGKSLLIILTICLTLAVTIVAAKLIGCTLPILAQKIGFDPAVMASPFITTIVDAVSLLVYFGFATIILRL